MNKLTTLEKSGLLIDYEAEQAKKLARKVIDKPKPPLWMILIPVFFVFFAYKMKEYKNGISDFCKNWMITREMCIEAACLAVENKSEPQTAEIVSRAGDLPAEAIDDYSKWVSLLTGYYIQLLSADGTSVEELMRRHFHNKSSYLLTIKQINRMENSYHRTLMPFMPGDQEDLAVTIEKINNWSLQLQKDRAELLF